MKWMEIIELRSVSSHQKSVEEKLKSIIEELDKQIKKQDLKLYSHISLENDYCIQLLYDSKNADINGSPLGMHLLSGLKEYGLVNHSVWIERHMKEFSLRK